MKAQVLYSQTYGENQMCSFSTRLITEIEVSNIEDAVEVAKEISIEKENEMLELIIDDKPYASYENGKEYKQVSEEIENKIKQQERDSKEKTILEYYKNVLCCDTYADMYNLLEVLEQCIVRHHKEDYAKYVESLMP